VQQEEALLGRLAVRQKLCTQEQVDECLRMQSVMGSGAPLGDLLVFKGYLTEVQLKDLLSRQHKKLMSCSSCALTFTVLTLSEGKPVRCPKCGGVLAERSTEGSTRSDADFSTRPIPVSSPSSGPRLRHVCIICEESFEDATDSAGRVQCPSCRSTFTSRGIR
jgi:DNA-directed RNA polymerase subunit RPC12/RpoP